MNLRDKFDNDFDNWELPPEGIEIHGDIPDDAEIDVYIDSQVIIQSYIDTSADEEELESIINYAAWRLRTLHEEKQNPGRASEWDVLGDK